MRRHRRVQRVRKKSIVRNWQRQERQTQKKYGDVYTDVTDDDLE